MLSKGGSNEVLATRGERDDPHPPVFGTFVHADQASRDETVHGYADRSLGEIHEASRAFYDPAHPQVEIEMNGIKKRIEEIEAGWVDEQEKLCDLEIAIASF
jgi:hypothetical protein